MYIYIDTLNNQGPLFHCSSGDVEPWLFIEKAPLGRVCPVLKYQSIFLESFFVVFLMFYQLIDVFKSLWLTILAHSCCMPLKVMGTFLSDHPLQAGKQALKQFPSNIHVISSSIDVWNRIQYWSSFQSFLADILARFQRPNNLWDTFTMETAWNNFKLISISNILNGHNDMRVSLNGGTGTPKRPQNDHF